MEVAGKNIAVLTETVRKNITVLIESITKYMNSLTYNPKLAITLSIAFVIIIVLHIVILHIEISNTGKLLWNPRSYQYIKITPKEDYLQLLKPDGSNLKSKEITMGSDKITLSYEKKDDSQSFFKLLDSKIDQIKLLEYAYRKCFGIVYDKNQPITHNRNIKLMIGIFRDKDNGGFAGAYVGDDKNMYTNNEFIQAMYEDTTEDEFIIYYIGLIIHEMTHIFNLFRITTITGKMRFGEHIAEYVRLVSGFQRNTKYWKVTKTSETVPPPYGAYGSYFLYWLNEKYPGFIQKLMSDMYLEGDVIETHKTITGKSEEELFAEFQKELPFF